MPAAAVHIGAAVFVNPSRPMSTSSPTFTPVLETKPTVQWSYRKGVGFGMLRSLIAFVSCAMLVGLTGTTTTFAASPTLTPLEQAAEGFLAKEANSRHWTITSQNLQTLSETSSPTSLTVDFIVTQSHLLDFASPNDVPIMQGMIREENALTGLSASRADFIQAYVAKWHGNLQRYIEKPTVSHEELKVVAGLNSDGTLNPSSIQVFGLADENGDWVSATTALASIVSPAAEAAMGQAIIASMAQSQVSAPAAIPLGSPYYNAYSAPNALSYAETYTSNPYNNNCGTNEPTDNTKYNIQINPNHGLPYYPWESSLACNDCADFVSQIMVAGGLPTDSIWNSSSFTNSDWYTVSGLVSYMTGKGYWVQQSSPWGVLAGGVVEDPNGSHVELVDYNDGSSALFDSHTSDRWEWGYVSSPYNGAPNQPGPMPWSNTIGYNVYYWLPSY